MTYQKRQLRWAFCAAVLAMGLSGTGCGVARQAIRLPGRTLSLAERTVSLAQRTAKLAKPVIQAETAGARLAGRIACDVTTSLTKQVAQAPSAPAPTP